MRIAGIGGISSTNNIHSGYEGQLHALEKQKQKLLDDMALLKRKGISEAEKSQRLRELMQKIAKIQKKISELKPKQMKELIGEQEAKQKQRQVDPLNRKKRPIGWLTILDAYI